MILKELYRNNLNVGGKIQVHYNFNPEYGFEGHAKKLQKFCDGSQAIAKDIESSFNFRNIDGYCFKKTIEQEFAIVEFLEKMM